MVCASAHVHCNYVNHTLLRSPNIMSCMVQAATEFRFVPLHIGVWIGDIKLKKIYTHAYEGVCGAWDSDFC